MDVIGNGLLLANGDLWTRQRKLMTPAFGYSCIFFLQSFCDIITVAYMKQMVPCFVEATSVLVNKWNNVVKSGDAVNVHTAITMLTLDVIGLVGFGYNFNAQTDPEARLPKAVATLLGETESRIFQSIPYWKLPFFPGTIQFQRSKKILLQEVAQMIKQRRAQGVSPDANDLLGRLLAAEDEETKETITDEQLRDELITFLIAGHGTNLLPCSYS